MNHRPKGPKVPPSDEKVWRSVHPNHLGKDGLPAYAAFRLTDVDQGWLSVACGWLVNAPEAHSRRIAQMGANQKPKQSAGIVSVTVNECLAEKLEVWQDATPEDDSHAEINLTEISPDDQRDRCKQLLAYALKRGWDYQPPVGVVVPIAAVPPRLPMVAESIESADSSRAHIADGKGRPSSDTDAIG